MKIKSSITGFVFIAAAMTASAGLTTDYLVVTANITMGTSTASTIKATAEGNSTHASGAYSHAEGVKSRASGTGSHAEGNYTEATGTSSHAEGDHTVAGAQAHAENAYNYANAVRSHAGGLYSRAQHTNSFIHATGSSTNAYKDTLFPDTGHFDRMILFEAANSHSNSVLARWEGDNRYAQISYLAPQGDIGMGSYTNGP